MLVYGGGGMEWFLNWNQYPRKEQHCVLFVIYFDDDLVYIVLQLCVVFIVVIFASFCHCYPFRSYSCVPPAVI